MSARRARNTRGPHLYTRELASGTFFYAYVGPGDRRALGTQDRAEAEARFAEELRRPARCARAEPPEEETLVDISRRYTEAPHGWTRRTQHSTELRAAAFIEAMHERGVDRPSGITPEILDAWRRDRAKEVSRATINRDETVAAGMLSWALERGHAAINPFADRAGVREPSRPKRRTVHSPAQIAKAVTWALAHRLRGWALTAATLEATGLRIDEVRRMDESWLTPTGVRLVPASGSADTAWTTKGYKPRVIDLNKATLAVVTEFVAWRLKGKGKTGKRVGISERWFGKVADKVTTAVKLPGTYRPHDARRRWVTELVRAGTPITLVQELIGHAEVQTTERYVCSYYDDPAAVAVPSPAAVAAFGGEAST